MIPFRWSWFFTFLLLVLPSCAQNDDHIIGVNVPRASAIMQFIARSPGSIRTDNAVGIALGVMAGVVVLFALIVLLFYLRKRRRAVNQIEDGVSEVVEEEKPQWWHIDLQSAKGTTWWVLETKGGGKEREDKDSGEGFPIKPKSHLDRLRYFLSKKKNVAKQDAGSLHDTFQSPTFPPLAVQRDSVARPLPAVPNSRPLYPTILDRPGNPPGFPPPSPFKNSNLARNIRAVESREKMVRRRAEVPPKILALPYGRTIPALPERKATAPRSPSGHRRRSWLSRQNFKNPFLPLKDSDAVLPSSVSAGLALRQQLANSPRSRSNLSAPATSPPDASRMQVVRRAPVPTYERRTTERPAVPSLPSTAGIPRPKYEADEGAMSALPLGYQFRRPPRSPKIF